MSLTSSSYTITTLQDAPSYQLQLAMSGLSSGTLSIRLYKNGQLYSDNAYMYVLSYDGFSWVESEVTGLLIGSIHEYSYTDSKAFDIQIYTDSTKTELLTTGFISYGETGTAGPSGTPGYLGLLVNGTTLSLKGYTSGGQLEAPEGYIYIDGVNKLTVPQFSLTLTGSGQGYILFDPASSTPVRYAFMTPTANGIVFKEYNTPYAVVSYPYIIGQFYKEGTSITHAKITSPQTVQDFIISHFMEILNTADTANYTVDTWASALGINTVFDKIAVLTAFIDKIFANTIEISAGGSIFSHFSAQGVPPLDGAGFYLGSDGVLKAKEIEIQEGSIYSGYSKEGEPPLSGAGYHLSPNGLLQAKDGKLIGTLRTGTNAPVARLGVRDESGITLGPDFSGSGLNDVSIINSGAVAVTCRVKIETVVPVFYAVGDVGPAGGVVFHKDGDTCYEHAPISSIMVGYWNPQGVNAVPLTESYVGGLSDAIGSGQENTNNMLEKFGSGLSSAKRIADYSYGGYSDWFLGSRGEMNALYNFALSKSFSGYPHVFLWESTERDPTSDDAGVVSLYWGSSLTGWLSKDNDYSILPIRSFTQAYDTFKVSVDDGASFGSTIVIPQAKTYEIPSKDITIAFDSRNGHSVGDYWRFIQGSMRGLVIEDSSGNEYLSASGGVVTITQINQETTNNKVYGAVFN